MKQEVVSYLSTIKEDIFKLSKYLYDNPEESFKEFKACNYITDILKNNGFKVTENYLDIATSFYAQYGNGYPKICYVCEYDAVKDLGHITGHNLISAMSIGAALSLSKVIDKIGGSIIVLGCPGEFKSGAKVTMSKQGTFEDIDAVLMAHPDIITAESGTSMAILPLNINYKSVEGLSYIENNSYTALDSCMFTFNAINMLSKGFSKNCSIDSTIVNAGINPYMLPSNAEARLYIRGLNKKVVVDIENKIKDLVTFVSKIMNTNSQVSIYELPYDELITNKSLSRIFSHNLKESGIINIEGVKNTSAGLSLGTVSHLVPCIHPYISIVESKSINYSTIEFASSTLSPYAQDKVIKTCQALALTGIDLIEKDSLLKEIKIDQKNQNKRD